MKTTTYKCDGCGDEIQSELVTHFEMFQMNFEKDGLNDKHYCPNCAVDLFMFIQDLGKKQWKI